MRKRDGSYNEVQPTISVCVRIGIQLGIFNILAESKIPKTARQLAEESKAEKLLIGEYIHTTTLNEEWVVEYFPNSAYHARSFYQRHHRRGWKGR